MGARARSARRFIAAVSAVVSVSVVYHHVDHGDQVVPAHQVDDIDEVHELDPVHQVDHKDEFTCSMNPVDHKDEFTCSTMTIL